METTTSKVGKAIRIPGPDHPITISPAEGRVRVTGAGRVVAESMQALRLGRRDTRLSTICRATMQTSRSWFGQAFQRLSVQG